MFKLFQKLDIVDLNLDQRQSKQTRPPALCLSNTLQDVDLG